MIKFGNKKTYKDGSRNQTVTFREFLLMRKSFRSREILSNNTSISIMEPVFFKGFAPKELLKGKIFIIWLLRSRSHPFRELLGIVT